MKINQDSIGDFFEAKGFNCKWFSPHYSVQSRKNAKFKIRNLEIFCDADFTNQKWCVQKGTLECVNMRNCGGTKESCRCSDERCKYLKSLVKDAQCWKLSTNLFLFALFTPIWSLKTIWLLLRIISGWTWRAELASRYRVTSSWRALSKSLYSRL